VNFEILAADEIHQPSFPFGVAFDLVDMGLLEEDIPLVEYGASDLAFHLELVDHKEFLRLNKEPQVARILPVVVVPFLVPVLILVAVLLHLMAVHILAVQLLHLMAVHILVVIRDLVEIQEILAVEQCLVVEALQMLAVVPHLVAVQQKPAVEPYLGMEVH
jgi:hypothetical protein